MGTNLEGTILGLDVGSRRIGLARINAFAKLSEPLPEIDLERSEAFETIKQVISQHTASAVVVGLPRGLEGQETEQTAYCRKFAEDLAENINLPVFLIDEAGTTKEAELRAKNSSESVDSIAASIILEDFVNLPDVESLRV